MGNTQRYRTIIVHDAETMNEIIDNAKKYTSIRYDRVKNYRVASQLVIGQSRLSLFTQWGEHRSTTKTEYQFWLDGTERYVGDPQKCYIECLKTNNAYKRIKKICEMDEWLQEKMTYDEENEKYVQSAPPMLKKFYKSTHEGKVWVYDLNSAYAWGLLQDQPDTTKDYLKDCEVPEGYIGFLLDDTLTRIDVGGYADIAFPAMESPFKKYVAKWYEKKKNAQNNEEKATAKEHLLIPIGFFQKTQPFIRANIVWLCNNFIARLVDENTVYVNTDAIYSTVPREDLDMGTGIGQFKLEYEGLIRMRDYNMQMVDEDGMSTDVKYRRVSKSRFDKTYNLLTDPLPPVNNKFEFNKDTMKVEEKV